MSSSGSRLPTRSSSETRKPSSASTTDQSFHTLAEPSPRSGASSSSSSLSPVSRLFCGRSMRLQIHSPASTTETFHTPAQSLGKPPSSSSSTSTSMSLETRDFLGAPRATRARSSGSTDRSYYTPEATTATASSSSSSTCSSSPSRRSDGQMADLLSNIRRARQHRQSNILHSSSMRERAPAGTSQPLSPLVEHIYSQLMAARQKLIAYEAQLNDEIDRTADITQLRLRIQSQQDGIDELVRELQEDNAEIGGRESPYSRRIGQLLLRYDEPGKRVAVLKRELASLLAYRGEAGDDAMVCRENIKQLRSVISGQQSRCKEAKTERERERERAG